MSPPAAAHPIFLTGAAGFIGSVLGEALTHAGHAVRRGSRSGGTGFVRCDLDQPADVTAAVAGAALVIHAAYGDSAAMESQCANLLAAMTAHGIGRLVYFSSIAVYGDATGTVDETSTPLKPLDGYGAAKIACEARIRAWAEEPGAAGRHAIILRPGIVYGAGSPFWVVKLSDRIRSGAWGTFGTAGEGTAALVHVDDVAAITLLAVERLLASAATSMEKCAIYNVVGPETPSWNAYFTAFAAGMATPPLPVIEGAALKTRQVAALGAKVWRKIGLPGASAAALAATPREIALFSRHASFPITRARDDLGYAPAVGLAEGLRRTFRQPRA